ncbi:helix-turn-helix transcriptional regulator [Streptomyces enissocaesilis]|uniref:HTH cro/C1-type domain-containing protein n=1 Tax=Streptomyces enissocaesilis TaxID=332589 RepID=A0ABN3XQB4_9ACTN
MRTNGPLIRRRRVELGHGVNRFAAIAGISGAALSRIENGHREPRPETLKKISNALGCPITEIVSIEQVLAGDAPSTQAAPARASNSDAAGGATPTASSEHHTSAA